MDHILERARTQGYVTAAEARTLGAHDHVLPRLVSSGSLTRIGRGIYAVPTLQHLPEAHAALTRAVLDNEPFSVASHHSALALQGVALHGVPYRTVHVASRRSSSRARGSVHHHVLGEADLVSEIGPHRVVGLPLAIAQVAARFGAASGLVAFDDALRRGLCTKADVEAVLLSGRLRRGCTVARRVLALGDGRAESPGESRLRLVVDEGPWPYDLQVPVGGPGNGYVVDLLVAGRVVMEYDGEGKYEGPDGSAVVKAEKRREDWLRERGYGFIRVTKAELVYPVTLRHRVHRALVSTPPRPLPFPAA